MEPFLLNRLFSAMLAGGEQAGGTAEKASGSRREKKNDGGNNRGNAGKETCRMNMQSSGMNWYDLLL